MVFVGAHEPLVDEALFNRVQQSIADNTRRPKNPDPDPCNRSWPRLTQVPGQPKPAE